MTKEQFTDLMGNLDDLLIAEAAARRTFAAYRRCTARLCALCTGCCCVFE